MTNLEHPLWPEEGCTGTSTPCELTISREKIGNFEFMRIDATDHGAVLGQIDVALDDFARALTGETVTAGFSAGRVA